MKAENVENRLDIDRIVELGVAANGPAVHQEADRPFVIIPSETKVADLSEYFAPKQIAAHSSLVDAESFSDYVNRFKTEATQLFATVTESGCKVQAIMDYHSASSGAQPATANRCLHWASFTTEQTPEWKTWMEANKKQMGQVAFATWLEDNAKLFVEPSGADLLELVSTLIGKSDVRFASAIRLQSGGNSLHYDEDVELKGTLTTKGGDIELPKILKAGIKPFQGSRKYEVEARLKYRIEGRKLSLWFETIAPHTIVREIVTELVKQIADKTGITPLLGTP